MRNQKGGKTVKGWRWMKMCTKQHKPVKCCMGFYLNFRSISTLSSKLNYQIPSPFHSNHKGPQGPPSPRLSGFAYVSNPLQLAYRTWERCCLLHKAYSLSSPVPLSFGLSNPSETPFSTVWWKNYYSLRQPFLYLVVASSLI